MRESYSGAPATVAAFKQLVANLLSEPIRTDSDQHFMEILQTIDGLAEKFRNGRDGTGSPNETECSLIDEIANGAYRDLDTRKQSLAEIQANTAVYVFNLMQKQAQLERKMQPLLKMAERFLTLGIREDFGADDIV